VIVVELEIFFIPVMRHALLLLLMCAAGFQFQHSLLSGYVDVCMFEAMTAPLRVNILETKGLFPIGRLQESAQGVSNGYVVPIDVTSPDNVIVVTS